MKRLLLFLSLAIGLSNQAFSQTVNAQTIQTSNAPAIMKFSAVNSLSWSTRALYNSAGRIIATWTPHFSVDTIAERTSGAGVNIDGLLIKDGSFTLGAPLTIANGGTGVSSLASGYVKSNGTIFTSSSTIPGSDISGNISGTAGGLSANIPISRTTGLQDSLTAIRNIAEFGRLYDSGWITVNAASINGSGTSPVSILAGTASRYNIPEFILFEYTAGGIGFTGGNMVIQGSGLAGDLTSPVNITGTGSFLTVLNISSSPNAASIATNNALVLSTLSGSNPSNGNGSVRIRIFYRRVAP